MVRRFLTILAIVVVLLLLPGSLTDPLRNGALRLTGPLARYLTDRNVGLRNSWMNVASLGNLREDHTILQQRVVDLEQQLITLEDLRRENNDLHKEIGVTGVTRSISKVFAHVIIQGDNPLDATFTVDAGRAQGVRVGQPVVAQGALIGRVFTVREQSSVVRAVTSLESGIQAWLTGSQEKGYLVGTGNGVELRKISQGVDVASGTVVETSGLGGSLPQGILIGQVATLQSDKSELSQTFTVTLPLNPSGVQSVFILLTDTP